MSGTYAAARRWAVARVAGLVLLVAGPAAAQVGANHTPTCVAVQTAGPVDAEAFRRLVAAELDRHPTHRAVTADCISHLRVELLAVGAVRHVTARINTQVPHREAVQGEALAEAVEEVLAVALNNDPVRLRGPRGEDFLRRNLAALKQGRFGFGVEVFQVGLALEGAVQGAPGAALSLRREVDRWHVSMRLAAAVNPGARGDALQYRGGGGLLLGLSWFFGDGDIAPHLGAVLGLEHQRFRGPSGIDAQLRDFDTTGFAAGVRLGVECLRTSRHRVDVFAQALLPAFVTHDENEETVDAWLPTVTLGVGAVF